VLQTKRDGEQGEPERHQQQGREAGGLHARSEHRHHAGAQHGDAAPRHRLGRGRPAGRPLQQQRHQGGERDRLDGERPEGPRHRPAVANAPPISGPISAETPHTPEITASSWGQRRAGNS
jgi:hypothetical protein